MSCPPPTRPSLPRQAPSQVDGAGSPVVAQEPPGELLRSGCRCPAVPHRQSEPSRLHVSHTSRDRLKLPPSPTLLRTGHLRTHEETSESGLRGTKVSE